MPSKVPHVERVRVGRFEWERLMVSSDLPRPTKGMLLHLAIFMSADGGSARPGVNGMTEITGKGASVVTQHLGDAVTAGWLDQVERGGHRPGRPPRANVYAATVPKEVHVRREEILNRPPWRRASTSEKPDVDNDVQPPENRSFTDPEPPVFRAEPPVFPGSTSGFPEPIKQAHHVGNITQQTADSIELVVTETGCSQDLAAAAIEMIRIARPPKKSLYGLIQTIIGAGEIGGWLRDAETAQREALAEDERKHREAELARERAAERQRQVQEIEARASGPTAEYLAARARLRGDVPPVDDEPEPDVEDRPWSDEDDAALERLKQLLDD